MSGSAQFPDDWPENCPPDEAAPADAAVFRLVKVKPPVEADFKTHRETGRLQNAPPCQRCGLSVFPTHQDAAHQQRLFPKLGEFIASAQLANEHGKLLATPSKKAPNHETWWPFENVIRHQLFSIVEMGESN